MENENVSYSNAQFTGIRGSRFAKMRDYIRGIASYVHSWSINGSMKFRIRNDVHRGRTVQVSRNSREFQFEV